jgi:hypothetical protein
VIGDRLEAGQLAGGELDHDASPGADLLSGEMNSGSF